METLTTIKKSRAVRQFSDVAVTDDQLQTILNAGRLSGSSKNSQPWRFIVVRDPDIKAALAACGRSATHLLDAPLAIVVVVPGETYWLGVDAGRASQNMFLAATSLGLGTCIAIMHDPACARHVLGLPDDMNPALTFSLGVPAAPPAPPGAPAPAPRQTDRQPLTQFVFYDRWGHR